MNEIALFSIKPNYLHLKAMLYKAHVSCLISITYPQNFDLNFTVYSCPGYSQITLFLNLTLRWYFTKRYHLRHGPIVDYSLLLYYYLLKIAIRRNVLNRCPCRQILYSTVYIMYEWVVGGGVQEEEDKYFMVLVDSILSNLNFSKPLK